MIKLYTITEITTDSNSSDIVEVATWNSLYRDLNECHMLAAESMKSVELEDYIILEENDNAVVYGYDGVTFKFVFTEITSIK